MLVHGAGSGPWIFDGWADSFPGTGVHAVDVHARFAVATASMEDFAAALVHAAAGATRPLAVAGWSMGGLVALMAAERVAPDRLILLESSPPGEIQGFDCNIQARPGSFDAEAVYGRFPPGIRSRKESTLARAERKRGISIPEISCRSLVVFGSTFPDDRGRSLAAYYGSDMVDFPDLDHWGLVLAPKVRRKIAEWLAAR